MPYEPDLLLVNANVLTMDTERPRASAVAVSGGRIAAVHAGGPDTSPPSRSSPPSSAAPSATPPASSASPTFLAKLIFAVFALVSMGALAGLCITHVSAWGRS